MTRSKSFRSPPFPHLTSHRHHLPPPSSSSSSSSSLPPRCEVHGEERPPPLCVRLRDALGGGSVVGRPHDTLCGGFDTRAVARGSDGRRCIYIPHSHPARTQTGPRISPRRLWMWLIHIDSNPLVSKTLVDQLSSRMGGESATQPTRPQYSIPEPIRGLANLDNSVAYGGS